MEVTELGAALIPEQSRRFRASRLAMVPGAAGANISVPQTVKKRPDAASLCV